MGRNSKNGGGSLISVRVRLDLNRRFCGPHLLACGIGIQVKSKGRVDGDFDVIVAVGTLGPRTIGF